MKTRQTRAIAALPAAPGFPDADALAALRAWYAGLDSRAAVDRYLGSSRATGQSSRGMLGHIRRQLAAFARSRHRPDLADVFEQTSDDRQQLAEAVERAIEMLRFLPAPQPQITDGIECWLAPRTVTALHAHGIRTLSELTVRIPRRRRWWTTIAGLGATGARSMRRFSPPILS